MQKLQSQNFKSVNEIIQLFIGAFSDIDKQNGNINSKRKVLDNFI